MARADRRLRLHAVASMHVMPELFEGCMHDSVVAGGGLGNL